MNAKSQRFSKEGPNSYDRVMRKNKHLEKCLADKLNMLHNSYQYSKSLEDKLTRLEKHTLRCEIALAAVSVLSILGIIFFSVLY